jgi:hypothetical protein
MNMSRVKQMQGMASGLFSSALFCLWLSTASLVVWVDLGSPSAEPVAKVAPAKPGSQATASTDAIKHH